ncbi:MAG: hypothetical protein ABW100_20765, partial [Candidatus Thiodiazotropha sp. 6PLUC3]
MNYSIFILLSFVISATNLFAADMSGGRDHPELPRVAGAEILGFSYSEYDSANFLKAEGKKKIAVENPEGKRTRILYLAKAGDTPLMVQKNYNTALSDLGKAKEIYSCKKKKCNKHILSTTLWSRDSMIPTEGVKQPFYLLAFSHNYNSPAYRYSEVVTENSRYHVGVFTAVLAENNANKKYRKRTVI